MNNAAADDQLMMQRARTNLSEALLHTPAATKAAYVEALHVCPELVETESNPSTFLRFEQFNYWSAANRLAAYWRKRYEYFGDRAFLPMDLTGNGAMNCADSYPMAAGCITMLTNSTIIVHDRTSEHDNADAATKLRRRFFFLQTLIEPCRLLEKGPTVFIYGFEISSVRRKMNIESKALMTDAFPIRNLEDIHLIFIKEKQQTLWQYLLPTGLEQMAGLISHLNVHNFDSVEQVLEGLSRFGVSQCNLPPKLGGTYHVESSPFVLERGLPLAKVNELRQLEQERLLEESFRRHDHILWYDNPLLHRDSFGKGSFDLLVDYFMRKAPDLPDVAQVDSLDPLKSFEPILLSSSKQQHTKNNDNRQEELTTTTMTTNPSCMGIVAQARSVSLYVESDAELLSEYQCQVRQQIEFFEAVDDDVTSSIRGRNKTIVLGQVGIRCLHCTHLPRQQRSKAATYYPTRLEGIYQTSQNLARKHLIDSCPFVSAEYKQNLIELCDLKSATGTGKRYWAETAQLCGVKEVGSILRFQENDAMDDWDSESD